MNPYSLAVVVTITFGIVAVIFIVCKFGKKTADTIGGTAETIAKQPHEIVKTVASETGETIREIGKPISKGIADICHATAQRISQKQKDLEELQDKIIVLTHENEQLRNRQIKVDQIQPIFQVAFFKANFSEINFVKEILKITPSSTSKQKEQIEYFGVYRATNQQSLGVDLESLKFRTLSPSLIEVSGLGRTELIGNSDPKVKDVHIELRRHLTDGTIRDDVHEIITGDPEGIMAIRERKQSSDLLATITQQQAVKEIDQAIEKMALQYLKEYFSPRGYNIVRAKDEVTDGKTIYQIRDEINVEIDTRINDTNRLLATAKQKKSEVAQELERDIQTISQV